MMVYKKESFSLSQKQQFKFSAKKVFFETAVSRIIRGYNYILIHCLQSYPLEN